MCDIHVFVMVLKVLRILEGDMVMDASFMSAQGYDVGNQSGRLWPDQQHQQYSAPLAATEALEEFSGKLSLESLRSGFWERAKARTSCEDHM